MPINHKQLQSAIEKMKDVYTKDHNLAVRGQVFIKILHEYCITELKERGLPTKGLILKPEVKLLTSNKKKDVDVALIHPTSGPLLVIGVRSQMSSLSKNFSNYYEMEVGDVSAIHERFPLCVVGLLYLHPSVSILPGSEKQSFDFTRAEKLLARISKRDGLLDPFGKYEEVGYLRVDFHKKPPTYDKSFPTIPALKIDDFFDNLLTKFRERNYFLD